MSSFVARLVSGIQSKQVVKAGRILIILAAIFMVMTSGEPAYADAICPRC